MAILRLKVNVYGMKGKLTLEKKFPLLYIIPFLKVYIALTAPERTD